jgi:ABC-type transport system involved in multi-copper enzyme maturation permease subunit
VIGRVYAIALNTFREAIRNRVLYGIVAVVILLNLFAMVIGEMSMHQESRVARDVGLAGVSLFGSITAIILGVSLLYGEIRRRTIHTILSKPLHRYEFVVGKYMGMAFTLSLLVALFTLSMAGLLALQGVPFTIELLKAVILSYFEVMIVAAVAIFFSSFSTPFLSGVFTFFLFVIGRLTPEIRAAIETAHTEWIRFVARVALRIVPDLHVFSVSGGTVDGDYVSVHGDFVAWSYVSMGVATALLWLVVLLGSACVIFSARDFS